MSLGMNEALALSSSTILLENPYLVRFYYAWLEENKLYLVVGSPQNRLSAVREASPT